MNIKRPLVLSTVLLSLGMASMVSACPQGGKVERSQRQVVHARVHQMDKSLTKEQKKELRQYMQATRQKVSPLMKEKRALRLQLMGKMATTGMHWQDVEGIVNEINAKQAQINIAFAKTQMKIFQKFGVMVPPPQGSQPRGHGPRTHAHP